MTLLGAWPQSFYAGEKVRDDVFWAGFHDRHASLESQQPKSAAYNGVGAFQLVRRSAYEKMGTHRRLAMEVIDDMKLGKFVKRGGISLRRGRGARRSLRGVAFGIGKPGEGIGEKFFCGRGIQRWVAAMQVASLLLFNVAPFCGLIFGSGWIRALAAVSVVVALCFHLGGDIVMRVAPWYCLTLPLGAVVFAYILLRSTVVTLQQGGIYWRGTFYKLEELRRGMV